MLRVVALLDRRVKLGLSVTDQQVYATVGDTTVTGAIERHELSGN